MPGQASLAIILTEHPQKAHGGIGLVNTPTPMKNSLSGVLLDAVSGESDSGSRTGSCAAVFIST